MRQLLLFATLGFSLQACAAPSLDIMPRYGTIEIDGEVSLTDGMSTGRADLNEAGLEDDGGSFQGRVDLDLGSPKIVLMSQRPRFAGSGVATADLTFNGETISQGTMVDSRLDLDLYNGYLLFDLFPGSAIEVALGLGASYVDLDFSFQEQMGPNEVAGAETFVLPMLAASVGVEVGWFELSALLAGLDAEYEGDDIRYFDLDVFGRMKLLGGNDRMRGSLIVGVRGQRIDVTYEDEGDTADADVDLLGPYAGIELRL